jgi:hypothetical protein
MPVVAARAADAFVDSIGVNVHLINASYNPVYETVVKPRLDEIGVRYVREGIQHTNTTIPPRLQELRDNYGITASLLSNGAQQTVDQAWTWAATVGYPQIAYIEGTNEPNSNGQTLTVGAHQQALFNRFRNTAATANLPVIGPSFTDWGPAEQCGDISAYMDYGNVHQYYGGRNPETGGWGSIRNGVANGSLDYSIINTARATCGNKPIIATECGWHDEVNSTSGHLGTPAPLVAKYMPRMLLFHYFHKAVVRSFVYELLDEAQASIDIERKFGLVRSDGTLKASGTALRNMIQVLQDPGAAFTPGSLNFTLSGSTADVYSALMQKRDGRFYLALWLGKQESNPDTRVEQPAAAQAVTVAVPGIASASVNRPNTDANFSALAVDPVADTFSLSVDGFVRIVQIAQATAAPTPTTPPTATGRATMADAFVDSIGVNVHLASTDYATTYETVVKPRLAEIGVRNVREGIVMSDTTIVPPRLQELKAQQGITASLVTNALQQTVDQAWTYAAANVGLPQVRCFEGMNEPNGVPATVQAHQPALYARVKGAPSTAGVPVIGPSFTDRTAANTAGDLSAHMDFGNVHHYYGGRNPETSGWGSVLNGVANGSLDYTVINVGRVTCGNKPIIATECGWHDAINSTSGHTGTPANLVARYMPRMFLYHYFHKAVVRSYMYELLDEPSRSLDIERAFGLVRSDGTLKASGTALKNLIAVLKDPGPEFVPDPLAFTLSGVTTNVFSALMQKRTGLFYLALWVGKQESNPDTKVETAAAPQAVTLAVPGLAAAAVNVPNTDANFANLTIANASVPLSLDGNVRIVRLRTAAPRAFGPADAFVDSIGVNTRMTAAAYSPVYETVVKPRLAEAGIRHVREPVALANATLATRVQDLNANSGVRAGFLADSTLQTADQVHGFVAATIGAPRASSVEGNYITTTNNLAATSAAYQQSLYARLKGDAATAAIPVVGPSLPDPATAAAVGNLSASLDYGNLRIAYSGRHPEGGGFGSVLNGYANGGIDYQIHNVARVACGPAKPLFNCECGWHDAVDSTSGHKGAPEAVVAKYMPRLFLFNYFHRDIVRSYLYDLLDQGTDPLNFAHNFGLLQPDGTPKAAFAAVKNLTALLRDPGASFATVPLDVAVTGATTDAYTALMQKRNGNYYLALWLGKQEYNPDTKVESVAADQSVTVAVPGMAAASVNQPNVGTALTPLAVTDGAFTLPVSGTVRIVEIRLLRDAPSGNLVAAGSWTTGGAGTATGGATVTINGVATGATYARQSFATVPGGTYWLTFEVLAAAVLPVVSVGTTAGGAETVAAASAAAGSNRVAFTAAASTTWVQFQRTGTGTSSVNAVSVERVLPSSRTARRLNGTTQYFQLNALSLGLRTANYSWYVGGWIRFDTATVGGVYVADFGLTAAPGGAGAGRVRLVTGTGTATKVFASSILPDGSSYRESSGTADVAVGSWYYIGVIATSTADVQVVWGATKPTTRTGTVPSLQATSVCQVLQLGARVGNPASGFAPASYSDWIWCSGTIPTDAQLQALAAGTRPNEVPGFFPTYHWPMSQEGAAEPSIAGAATLTAVSAPLLAVGPASATPAVPAVPSPMDIIIV